MEFLLPKYEELQPIKDDRKTFFDSLFKNDFCNLSFKSKLQIINDLVRQTMLIESIPNPETEFKNMKGDEYTASRIAIKYMQYLKVGKNHRLVIGRKRKFELENTQNTQILVLVEDEKNLYQFDSSPFIGYKHGCVEKIL